MLADYSGEKTYQEKQARISSKVNILIFNFSGIIRLARKFLSSETRNTTHTARSINSHTLLVETSTSFYSNTTYLFSCLSNHMGFEFTESEMCTVWRNLNRNTNEYAKQNNIYDMMHAWPIRPHQKKKICPSTMAIYEDYPVVHYVLSLYILAVYY